MSAANSPECVIVILSITSGGKKVEHAKAAVEKFFAERSESVQIICFNRRIERLGDIQLKTKVELHQPSKLLVVGGDGTLRAVAQECFQKKIDVPLGFIPNGSANICAFTLGVPLLDLQKALTHVMQCPARPAPIGILNDEHVFLLSACFGRLAFISVQAEVYHKQHVGFLAYLWSAIRHLVPFHRRNVYCSVDGDEKERMYCHSVIVFLRETANTFIPVTERRTSALESFFFLNASLFGFFEALMQTYVFRSHSKRVARRSGEVVEIEGAFGRSVHIDGDIVRLKGRMHSIRVEQNALQFLWNKETL